MCSNFPCALWILLPNSRHCCHKNFDLLLQSSAKSIKFYVVATIHTLYCTTWLYIKCCNTCCMPSCSSCKWKSVMKGNHLACAVAHWVARWPCSREVQESWVRVSSWCTHCWIYLIKIFAWTSSSLSSLQGWQMRVPAWLASWKKCRICRMAGKAMWSCLTWVPVVLRRLRDYEEDLNYEC